MRDNKEVEMIVDEYIMKNEMIIKCLRRNKIKKMFVF
jgi:hypothetical protein